MDRKKMLSIAIFIILLIAVPITIYLVRNTQIFKSRAAFTPHGEFLDMAGNPLPQSSGIAQTNSTNVKLKIVGVETSAVPTTSPFASSTPAPTAPPTGLYNIKVLVIKYFPLTPDGQNIDIAVTGDVGESYSSIRQLTTDITNNLVIDISKGTKYLGYSNTSAQPALTYTVVDTKEHTTAVPISPRGDQDTYPDYNGIMSSHGICNYVDNQGVREVWLWAYQGPNRANGQPFLGISESKMSGPNGDISNSPRFNDMPICQHTYRVYTFNYGRGTAEALHSWGHQMEAEFSAVDNHLFRDLWQGPGHPQTDNITGRCGSVHNPPNSREEYDYANSTPQNSDCLDWNPDSLGTLSSISCLNWGCVDIDDSNNTQLNYLIWNNQNIPGIGNTKTYQGRPLRNWWDVHGDFDNVMTNSKRLTL